MWVYHIHYGLKNGAFTESTTVGLGWYLLMLGVVIGIALFRFSGKRR